MNQLRYRKNKSFRPSKGFSLPELLVVMALSGLIAAMSISMLNFKRPESGQLGRVAEDYFHLLSATYNEIVLMTGQTPMTATDIDTGNLIFVDDPGVGRGNIGFYLYTREKGNVTYEGSTLTYPNNIEIYTRPNSSSLPDPSNEIPNCSGCDAGTQIMSTTTNREWILLDMNGINTSPNTIGPTGDRVLIYVEDETGRILTAYQKCQEVGATCTGDQNYPQSFYDMYKGY